MRAHDAAARLGYLPPTINAAALASGALAATLDALWALAVTFVVEGDVDALVAWFACAMADDGGGATEQRSVASLFDGAALARLLVARDIVHVDEIDSFGSRSGDE